MKKSSGAGIHTQRKSVSDLRKTTKRYSITQTPTGTSLKSTKIFTTKTSSNNNQRTVEIRTKNKSSQPLNNFIQNLLPQNLAPVSRPKTSLKNRQFSSDRINIYSKQRKESTQLTNFKEISQLSMNSNKLRKIAWNEVEEQNQPLIFPADFIIDQDDFWEKPNISHSIIKAWKILHKQYYVILVIKTQKVYIKIRQFINLHQLPFHAIYYLKYRRKYTNDYTPIIKQIKKTFPQNMCDISIVQLLKLNTNDLCSYQSFSGKVPIIQNNYSISVKAYFIRQEDNQNNLDTVLNALKNTQANKLMKLSSVHQFIEQYYQQLLLEISQSNHTRNKRQVKVESSYLSEEQAEERVQVFKRSLIDSVITQKGRQFQFEGNSVYYFVGDIIKRNYNKLVRSSLMIPKTKKPQKTVNIQQMNQIEDQQTLIRKMDHNNIEFYEYMSKI